MMLPPQTRDLAQRLLAYENADLIDTESMPITQEFLGQMLGARRASVSVAASTLQKAGLISYTRGNVTILDKHRVREAACNCYEIIQNQQTDWRKEAQ